MEWVLVSPLDCRSYNETPKLSLGAQDTLRNVHRRIFMVFLRMSTHKESVVSEMGMPGQSYCCIAIQSVLTQYTFTLYKFIQ